MSVIQHCSKHWHVARAAVLLVDIIHYIYLASNLWNYLVYGMFATTFSRVIKSLLWCAGVSS